MGARGGRKEEEEEDEDAPELEVWREKVERDDGSFVET